MKTKRVRIAVAVTSDGDWAAGGYLCFDGDEALRQFALDTLVSDDDIYHVVWVEADVPIPEAQRDVEVKGEVAG